jgi:hypothetical protein
MFFNFGVVLRRMLGDVIDKVDAFIHVITFQHTYENHPSHLDVNVLLMS